MKLPHKLLNCKPKFLCYKQKIKKSVVSLPNVVLSLINAEVIFHILKVNFRRVKVIFRQPKLIFPNVKLRKQVSKLKMLHFRMITKNSQKKWLDYKENFNMPKKLKQKIRN